MPLPPAIRDPAISAIERFCLERAPPEARDQIRLGHRSRGNAITLVEQRPSSRCSR